MWNTLSVLALEGNAYQKKGSILCALKWRQWRAEVLILWITNCIYSARTMYVIPSLFWQHSFSKAAGIVLATILHRGYQSPLPAPWAACWWSTRCHSLIRNYLTTFTGFYTHALMHTKDTSRKFPVPWSCAVEYIVWEHWADLASVCSTFLQLYKLPGLYGCKVLGTLTWIILMFCRLRFDQWTFQFKGLYPGFLHLFPCIILICVILLTSGEYLCFYD